MANYILFDKLVEEGSSFIRSAKELFDTLGIHVKYDNNFKKDTGFKTKALCEVKFHATNAYNITLASRDNGDILCVENSSFLSLALSKNALLENAKLKISVEKELGMELDLKANIIHINELLRDSVGFEKIQTLLKTSFQNFNASIYEGSSDVRLKEFTDTSSNDALVKLLGATIIKTSTCKKSDGYEVLETNSFISDSLAGVVLLDAFDNAADFILVNDVTTFKMFDARQKSIATVVGRDIDLPVLNIAQVLLLALGIKDKDKLGLGAHKVKVTLL